MFKTKIFLILCAFAFSSTSIPAIAESGSNSNPCGSEEGWNYLQKANRTFIKNPKYKRQRNKTADSQNPPYVVLSCSDSRTAPEVIFNQGLGRIFCPRVAGNTAGDQVIDSIAFAVTTWDVNTVVVLGHENCGAVIGALDRLRANGGVIDPDNGVFNAVLIPIERAIVEAGINIYAPNALELATRANVAYTANQLIIKSPKIANALTSGQIVIIGAVYSLSSGKAQELFVWNRCGITYTN